MIRQRSLLMNARESLRLSDVAFTTSSIFLRALMFSQEKLKMFTFGKGSTKLELQFSICNMRF